MPPSREELRAAGVRLLRTAAAVRSGFPDVAAMGRVELGGRPFVPTAGDPGLARLWTALAFLWDEVDAVRSGRAGTLAVLDDEVVYVAGLLDPRRPLT